MHVGSRLGESGETGGVAHVALLLFVFPFSSSVGVALSRGHGKYFFRGNVTVDSGTSSSKSQNTVACVFSARCIVFGSVLSESLQAGTAEA